MRFLMLLKAGKNSEAGVMPDDELLDAMGKYNGEMMKAGVLLGAEGLHPSAEGVRVRFAGGKPRVIGGPFGDAKDLIAGLWMIQAKSKEEAIEWASRCPDPKVGEGGNFEIELRHLYEPADSPPEDAAKEAGGRARAEKNRKG